MKVEAPPEILQASAHCLENEGADARLRRPSNLNRIIDLGLRSVAGVILCMTILAVFVPLEPAMPASGLDPSWMYALNQAVAQRLVFGRDIVLTFGPYASIYTELYHPATDRLMTFGSAFLALSYFLALLLLGKSQKPYFAFFYGLFLAGFVTSRDALLYSYPLIVGLITYRLTLPDGHATKLSVSNRVELSFAILFAPLGFLPLVKVSLLPLCGLTTILCALLLWNVGKKALACAAAAAPAISCVALWVVAGQPVFALPKFVFGTQQIIAGYTEAMAYPGDPWECFLYLFASIIVLVVAVRPSRAWRFSSPFLAAMYGAFLFLGFKGGFVRHDPWHNMTAGSAIVIAGFSLVFVSRARRGLPAFVLALFAWAYIGHGSIQNVAEEVPANFMATFAKPIHGVEKRLTPGELEKEYDEHVVAIQNEFPIDRMPGTTDIYSYNQAGLFASGNAWSPRPVLQSYSAYTPDLARTNLAHLEGAGAPDNIVFRVEPIDGRLASLEDGLSWPAIVNRYSITKLEGQAAYLQKRTAVAPHSGTASSLYEGTHKFGDEVSIPAAEEPLFARIEIRPTLLGRALAFLFKPPQLHISLRLSDGRVMQYRTISNMMKTDFLITPLVTNTEEFALLAAGGTSYLKRNEVQSVVLSSDDSRNLFWNPSFSVSLSRIELRKDTETEASLLFDNISDRPPASVSAPSVSKCEGSIESLNGSLAARETARIAGALYVSGWMGIAAKDGIVPDSVFVSLTSEGGKTYYFRAHSTRREDIKLHFNQPHMRDPGYAAMIDVSRLKGSYTLGLARTFKENLGICEQFKLPLLINP